MRLYDAVLQANLKSLIYVTKLGSSGCVHTQEEIERQMEREGKERERERRGREEIG